jgi:hypothetical protein
VDWQELHRRVATDTNLFKGEIQRPLAGHALVPPVLTPTKERSMAKFKHITEPDKFGYQVRIVRRGKEYSRYFSHKLWGGKAKSLKAAIAWRDQMLVALKGSKARFLKPPKNKTTTGITGVSRTIKHDHRKDKSYLCYTVFWVDNGKSRNKTFQVGNVGSVTADGELHAFRTARLFRSCYEHAIDNDLPFHDDVFAGWKQRRVYEDEGLKAV